MQQCSHNPYVVLNRMVRTAINTAWLFMIPRNLHHTSAHVLPMQAKWARISSCRNPKRWWRRSSAACNSVHSAPWHGADKAHLLHVLCSQVALSKDCHARITFWLSSLTANTKTMSIDCRQMAKHIVEGMLEDFHHKALQHAAIPPVS